MMEEMQAKADLFKRLVKVMGSVDKITKSGDNEGQNYQYATEADLITALKASLIAEDIFIFSGSETKEVVKLLQFDKYNKRDKETVVAVVNTTHTFACGITGATFEVGGTGVGWDSHDKGVYKALTGAMKYFLMKNFLIATEDDPEKDNANTSYVRDKAAKATTTSAPRKSFGKAFNKAETVETKEEPKEEPKVAIKAEVKIVGDVVQTPAEEPVKRKSFGQRKFITADKKEASF